MGAIPYRWVLADEARESDVSLEDTTKIRVSEVEGARLRGTWDPVLQRLEYPLSPWYVDVAEVTIGAFSELLALDVKIGRESTWAGATSPRGVIDPDPDPTSVLIQMLVDGSPYWWSGATWEAAADNTEANTIDVAQTQIGHASLQALILAAGGALAVRLVLETTNVAWTPTVEWVDLLVELDPVQSGVDDAVIRTLGGQLAALTIPGVWQDVAPTGGLTEIDLTDLAARRATPYAYSEILAVYDLTADPDRATDLYSGGFTPSTQDFDGRPYTVGTIDLDSPIAEGNTYEVRFRHSPRVAPTTARDFGGADGYELADYLEIQLRDPVIDEEVRQPVVDVIGRRTDPGAGVNDGYTVTGGRTLTLSMIVAPRSPIGLDLDLMGQALREWAGHGRVITSLATGLRMGLEVRSAGTTSTTEAGRLQSHDLELALYSVREPGTAEAVKLHRTSRLDGSTVPLR